MTNDEAAKVLTEHLRTLTDYDAREAYHCAIDALSVDEAKERERFEALIKRPPYEHMCDRLGEVSAWPGHYKRFDTQLAWEFWLARARGE